MSQLSHAQFPLRPISSSTIDGPRSAAVAEPRGANDQSRDRLRWPASFRNGGRHQIGTAADIKSESLDGLNRNSQTFADGLSNVSVRPKAGVQGRPYEPRRTTACSDRGSLISADDIIVPSCGSRARGGCDVELRSVEPRVTDTQFEAIGSRAGARDVKRELAKSGLLKTDRRGSGLFCQTGG
jgi:hypothetical protein